MSHWSEALERLDACDEAADWARAQPDYATAWAKCRRGDWMLWLLGRTDMSAPWSDERKPLVACAAACAAGMLEFMFEGKTRDSAEILLSVLQAWCEGAATCADVKQSQVETYSSCTYHAAATASVAESATLTASGVSDIVAAAISYQGNYGDIDRARARSLAASAGIVRSHFPNGPVLA